MNFMIGKRSFANMESMTAIGWIKKKKKFLFLHEKQTNASTMSHDCGLQ